jgi:hypothetical protein
MAFNPYVPQFFHPPDASLVHILPFIIAQLAWLLTYVDDTNYHRQESRLKIRFLARTDLQASFVTLPSAQYRRMKFASGFVF